VVVGPTAQQTRGVAAAPQLAGNKVLAALMADELQQLRVSHSSLFGIVAISRGLNKWLGVVPSAHPLVA
jgi:hypothetical protein